MVQGNLWIKHILLCHRYALSQQRGLCGLFIMNESDDECTKQRLYQTMNAPNNECTKQ